MSWQYDQDELKEVMKVFSLGRIDSLNEFKPSKIHYFDKYKINTEDAKQLISLCGGTDNIDKFFIAANNQPEIKLSDVLSFIIKYPFTGIEMEIIMVKPDGSLEFSVDITTLSGFWSSDINDWNALKRDVFEKLAGCSDIALSWGKTVEYPSCLKICMD